VEKLDLTRKTKTSKMINEMKKWIIVGIVVILVGCGCSTLEQLAGHSETITEFGQSVTEAAPAIAVFKPDLALLAGIIGGLIVAAGEGIKFFKKGK